MIADLMRECHDLASKLEPDKDCWVEVTYYGPEYGWQAGCVPWIALHDGDTPEAALTALREALATAGEREARNEGA